MGKLFQRASIWACIGMAGFVYGDAAALYKQGSALYKNDPFQALELFEQAAEGGNVSAMVGAGHCYETGTGTRVDFAKAISFYEQAVKQNSLKACEGLARIYASCPDPEFHDGEKAVKFARMVVRSKRSDPDALMLLAKAHARNIDFQRAVIQGRKAVYASRSTEEAKELRAILQKFENQRPEPNVRTFGWDVAASDEGISWAMEKMLRYSSNINHELYDPVNGLQLCKALIERGESRHYITMGVIHFNEDRYKEAFRCFKTAKDKKVSNKVFVLYMEFMRYLKEPPEEAVKMAERYKNSYTTQESYSVPSTQTGYNHSTGKTYTYSSTTTKYRTVTKPPRPDASAHLYLIAAKLGNVEGMKQAFYIYSSGRGKVHPNPERAEKWKWKLKEQGVHVPPVVTFKSSPSKDENLSEGKDSLVSQARTLVNQEKYDEALALFIQAYEEEPSPGIAFETGSLYLRIRQPVRKTVQATDWLKIAHEDGYTEATKMLVEVYACGKDRAFWSGSDAVKYAEILEKADEDHDARTFSLIACAYGRNGRYMKAEKFARKAMELSGLRVHSQQYNAFKRGEAWPD